MINRDVNITIDPPHWHVLQVNIELKMNKYDLQMDLDDDLRNHDLVSDLRKDVKKMKSALEFYNYLFN